MPASYYESVDGPQDSRPQWTKFAAMSLAVVAFVFVLGYSTSDAKASLYTTTAVGHAIPMTNVRPGAVRQPAPVAAARGARSFAATPVPQGKAVEGQVQTRVFGDAGMLAEVLSIPLDLPEDETANNKTQVTQDQAEPTSESSTNAITLAFLGVMATAAAVVASNSLARYFSVGTKAFAERQRAQLALMSVDGTPAVNLPDVPEIKEKSNFEKFAELFANLFPLWTALGAGVAVAKPVTFSFMSTNYFTAALAILMFSMGITMTVDDFKRVFGQPGPVALNFLACYGLMPALAYGISIVCGLPPAYLAGMVLVGSINGGQASNLCTYIAKGDVALSVLMTTSTTIGTMFMTPLIAKLVLGTIVPVDAIGIAMSTVQVVFVPIALGVVLNSFAPKFCRAVEPYTPILGVISTVILVGAAVAQCSEAIIASGLTLQLPCALLHLVGGIAGYWACRAAGFGEKIGRTTAIETSMKSSAFGFLLASLHFADPMVRVPAAVSVVWMALIGSTMAVVWRFLPIKEE